MEPVYLRLSELKDIIIEEIKHIINKIGTKIKLAVIVFGNDPASLSYIRGMKNNAEKIGLEVEILDYDENIKEEDFFCEFQTINSDTGFSGIIVQLPFPAQISYQDVSLTIDNKKDIDCINPFNQGLLYSGRPFLIPATALAVSLTLEYIKKKFSYELTGRNACIVGRSLSVGRPVFHLLLGKNITPSIVHTKTIDAYKISSFADIVIASCGIPELIDESWIKQDAVVIDVGIHSVRNENNESRLCGDIDGKSVINKASILTAVPGGIGLITSSLIFANAIKSFLKIRDNKNFVFEFEKELKA